MKIIPNLLERHCGGWMALCPEDAPVRFCVVADTKEEVCEKFATSLDQWRKSLDLSFSSSNHTT